MVCHTSTCICHGCTRVPHTEFPSHLLPHPIPLDHPSAPAPSTLSHASNLDWRFISHMITYMFQSQIIPPSPSPTESRRLFYTSVSLLLWRGFLNNKKRNSHEASPQPYNKNTQHTAATPYLKSPHTQGRADVDKADRKSVV